MEREWRNYYRNRQKPRVSCDAGEPGVEPTSFLQLPFWLTLVVICFSTALHWVVSHILTAVEQVGRDPQLVLSQGAIVIAGIIATVLVLGINIPYFVPIRSWMPLLGGSLKVVLHFCHPLSFEKEGGLPEGGIAWGDISTASQRRAGFGEKVSPMTENVDYPKEIYALPEEIIQTGPRLSMTEIEELVPRT